MHAASRRPISMAGEHSWISCLEVFEPHDIATLTYSPYSTSSQQLLVAVILKCRCILAICPCFSTPSIWQVEAWQL